MPSLKIPKKFKPLFDLERAEEVSELSKVKTVIITGGRLSGKSFCVGVADCGWVHKYAHKTLYTRYTLTSTEDSIIPEFEEKIELLDLSNFFEIKKKEIIHSNGAEIKFKGIKTSSGNQTANLKSLKGFSRWILDEAEEMPDFDTWDKIRLSIRHPEKRNICVMMLNPTTKTHWIYKHFFIDKGVKAGFNGVKDGVLYIHSTYLDLPKDVIPKDVFEYYEAFRYQYEKYESLTPEEQQSAPPKLKKDWKYFKEVILGGWLDRAEGVVFNDWEEGEFPETDRYVWGLDYGFSKGHETGLVKTHIDHVNKLIYLKEYFYSYKLQGIEGLADMLAMNVKPGEIIVADSAGKMQNTDLINRGFNIYPAQKGQNSVKEQLALMMGYTLIVDPSSYNLKMELENYVYGDNVNGNPIKEFDNLIDPSRYAVATQLIHGDFV